MPVGTTARRIKGDAHDRDTSEASEDLGMGKVHAAGAHGPGRIQLTVRFDDGQRSSLVLDLRWAGTSQAELITTAEKLKALMSQGRCLNEAHQLLAKPTVQHHHRRRHRLDGDRLGSLVSLGGHWW